MSSRLAPDSLGATQSAGAVERHRFEVRGVVQGVGFRPFVHRLATELRLSGFVGNDAAKVFIEVQGRGDVIGVFAHRVRTDAPPLAVIESINDVAISVLAVGHSGSIEDVPLFEIVASVQHAGAVTLVSPDVATCDECLAEMLDPADRRFGHPFITCTNCGPRFTIIRTLPYDRPNTTMSMFAMCRRCAQEYADPDDRRYHAQPIACHDCGPKLTYRSTPGGSVSGSQAVGAAQSALASGKILAIKGIGGFHLVCLATSDRAVGELRRRKGREDKPFAVMVADLAMAAQLATFAETERALLVSPARPIVLLRGRSDTPLSPAVAPDNPLIGVMLPYSPVHHLLFAASAEVPSLGPLVVTSGNHNGAPIAFRDADASDRLDHLVDGFLTHDRPIHLPCDDSVVRVVDGDLLPIRRSRGYAPLPVRFPAGGPDVLAVGGELKNTFCVASGDHAWMSQHIGDMANLDTVESFEQSVGQFCELYRIDPGIVVADAHPGYLTARWARTRFGPTVLEAQHHHAHVAAVLAEHGRDPSADVIGIAFDGTGYGDDGTIWGGEILVADAGSYERFAHLRTVPLPGGDAAIRNPSRVALAHLWAADVDWDDGLAPVAAHTLVERNILLRQFETGFGCVPTSSMGRLFDAVSALIGLRQRVTYEAQAAIDLEVAAAGWLEQCPTYRFAVAGADIDAGPVITAIARDALAGSGAGPIAAGFHLAVVALLVDVAEQVRAERHLDVVALTGGVFQNVMLVRLACAALADAGFEVLTHRLVPPNDGGLALGQAFIAAYRSAVASSGTTAAGETRADVKGFRRPSTNAERSC